MNLYIDLVGIQWLWVAFSSVELTQRSESIHSCMSDVCVNISVCRHQTRVIRIIHNKKASYLHLFILALCAFSCFFLGVCILHGHEGNFGYRAKDYGLSGQRKLDLLVFTLRYARLRKEKGVYFELYRYDANTLKI